VEVYHRESQPDSSPTAPCEVHPQRMAGPEDARNEIRFEGQAEVSDDRVARVTFKEGERVFEVAVRPGQAVKPGDLLFTLKGVHLQQMEQAAAEAVAAKRKRLQAATELAAEKRRVVGLLRQLQGKGAATADEVRRAESDAVQAERAVEYHRSQLREQELAHGAAKAMANEEYVTLPEGFRHSTGLVRRVTITPGDMRRGTAFQGVEVVNVDRVTVRVVLPARQRQWLAAARRARPVLKAVASLDGVEFPAALAPPGIDADPATGAVPTVVTIENTREPRLPIGARVAIRIAAE
jgi:multidrug efflux pump subunit AcrA (membrane-fusion protein)